MKIGKRWLVTEKYEENMVSIYKNYNEVRAI